MKSLLKFALLSALIISGKLAKQGTPVAAAQTVKITAAPDTSMVFVHQILPSDNVAPAQSKAHPEPANRSLLADIF